MSRIRRLATPLIASIALLVALLAARPISTARSLAIWTLVLAAIALSEAVRHAREGAGSRGRPRFEAALARKPPTPSAPVELLRMERELELGIASASHAHRRTLPLLRAAAGARLGSRRGIDLERNPAAARSVLGDDVWELLRADRPEPEDRHSPGVPRREIELIIDRLESA